MIRFAVLWCTWQKFDSHSLIVRASIVHGGGRTLAGFLRERLWSWRRKLELDAPRLEVVRSWETLWHSTRDQDRLWPIQFWPINFFCHLGFGPANLGQNQFWPIQFWPIHFYWPIHFWIWCESWWGPQTQKKSGPEGWGAQHFELFSPLPLPIFGSFLSLSLGVFSWNFCWCLKRRSPHMCAFGVRRGPQGGPGAGGNRRVPKPTTHNNTADIEGVDWPKLDWSKLLAKWA